MGIPISDYQAMLSRLEKSAKPGAAGVIPPTQAKPLTAAPGIRIRQSAKPLMNKLESEWMNRLAHTEFSSIRAQSKRFKLGNGIWYKPDFTAINDETNRETAWEVKGPHAFRGGFENLKIAAGLFDEIDWILVWKESGQWKQQKVLP